MDLGITLFLVAATFVIQLLIADCTSRRRPNELCEYRNHKAFCLNRGYDLTYIPELPSYITYLKFQGNSLRLINRDIFRNVTKLSTLILVNNKVANISSDSLLDLKHLKTFKLGSEPFVRKSQIGQMLYNISRSITDITFANMKWKMLPPLDGLIGTNISTLCFPNNRILFLHGETFQDLEKLRKLGFSYNGISNYSFTGLEHLENLDLSGNWLSKVPNFCTSPPMNLKWLHLQNNKISTLFNESFHCLKKLEYLNLNGHALRKLYNNTLSGLPSLRTLSLRRLAGQLSRIDSLAFNSSSLKSLYLSNSYFSFSVSSVDVKHIFAHCPNLKDLDISHNKIRLNESDFLTMIGSATTLRQLTIIGVSIHSLPSGLMTALPSLQVLNASRNTIVSLNGFEVFSNSTSLREINLSNTGITTINETTFPEPMISHLKNLILANNSFSCHCDDMQWFFEWMTNNKDKLKLHELKDRYLCSSPKQMKDVPLINLTYRELCPIDPILEKVIIACASMIGIVLLVLTILYKMRWNIRQLMYEMRKKRKRSRRNGYSQIVGENDFLFDCFPVYADEDLLFVKDSLIPVLETKHGRKLCVRDRDYIPGSVFVDTISDSIENSRKVMLVLSNKFARSKWCQLQLKMVLQRMIEENNNVLVVVMLHEISYRYLSCILKTLITTSRCISWSEDETGSNLFWEKVIAAIPSSSDCMQRVTDNNANNYHREQFLTSVSATD